MQAALTALRCCSMHALRRSGSVASRGQSLRTSSAQASSIFFCMLVACAIMAGWTKHIKLAATQRWNLNAVLVFDRNCWTNGEALCKPALLG